MRKSFVLTAIVLSAFMLSACNKDKPVETSTSIPLSTNKDSEKGVGGSGSNDPAANAAQGGAVPNNAATTPVPGPGPAAADTGTAMTPGTTPPATGTPATTTGSGT